MATYGYPTGTTMASSTSTNRRGWAGPSVASRPQTSLKRKLATAWTGIRVLAISLAALLAIAYGMAHAAG